MPTYHRWFLLPVSESSTPEQAPENLRRRPKYVGDGRLDGFSTAGPFSRRRLEYAGFDHLLAHNDADEWLVVCTWGEGNAAWSALNAIHAHNHDTETLADHGDDVAPVLDERFGEGQWSIGWAGYDNSENTG